MGRRYFSDESRIDIKYAPLIFLGCCTLLSSPALLLSPNGRLGLFFWLPFLTLIANRFVGLLVFDDSFRISDVQMLGSVLSMAFSLVVGNLYLSGLQGDEAFVVQTFLNFWILPFVITLGFYIHKLGRSGY